MADLRGSGAPARTVIVTRPADQAAAWVAALVERGQAAQSLPLIGIAPGADLAAIDAAWAELDRLDLLIFVSQNAVARFFAQRPPDRVWPPAVRVAAPGPGTGQALRELGVPGDCLVEPAADAAQFDSESLWQQLGLHDWRGTRVLIVRGDGGREWLAAQLGSAGAEVRFLAAYRRSAPQLDPAMQGLLDAALARPQAWWWLFSSSEAIQHLLDAVALPAAALRRALQASSAIVTHPRIAERARAASFGRVLECRPGVDAVVACIQSADA